MRARERREHIVITCLLSVLGYTHDEKKYDDDAKKYIPTTTTTRRFIQSRERAQQKGHAPTATFWLTDIASEISSVVISSYFSTIRFGHTSTCPGTTGFKFTNAKESGVS